MTNTPFIQALPQGDGAKRGRTILVTGFGAFPGAPRNPTQAIVAALGRHRSRLERLGLFLHVAVLPVRFAELDGTLADLAACHRPDVVLHLGVASRRRRLSIETRAINRAGPLHPDASGRRPGQILVPGGPSALPATYPAPRILAALRKSGIAAERSIDAGDYVCNATLFRALLVPIAKEIGFIHVPKGRTDARPLHRVRHARMTTGAMTQSVLLAILALAPRPTILPRNGSAEGDHAEHAEGGLGCSISTDRTAANHGPPEA